MLDKNIEILQRYNDRTCGRDNLKGIYKFDDNNIIITNWYWYCIFNTPDANNYLEKQTNPTNVCKPEGTKFITTKDTKDNTLIIDDTNYYNLTTFKKIIKCYKNPELLTAPFSSSEYRVLVIKADNGSAILLPLRRII